MSINLEELFDDNFVDSNFTIVYKKHRDCENGIEILNANIKL